MDESFTAYQAARKSGLLAYNRMVSLGRPGNLPYLDDLLLDVEIVSRETLGIMELPLKKIIGTYSAGRSRAFSENFMPLLDPESEFGMKWRNVYNYQLSEGLRDAIKVYEYLNWYYVVEGNKRVSVLKHIDAGSVLADVTRLVPKFDAADANIRQYYEFLKFYRETHISGIWLDKPGGYKMLIELIRGMDVPKVERGDSGRYFINQYYVPFRTLLYELGGDKLPYTTGEVFLRYFDLFKLHKVMPEADMRPRLRALLDELKGSAGEEAGLNTSPGDVPEPSLLSSIFHSVLPRAKTKIAFAYSGLKDASNWAKAHENGRLHIQDVLGDEIETTYVDNVSEDIAANKVFKRLIEEGCNVIFATSPAFANAALRTALEFPQARIYVCSEQHPFKHVHTYFGRIYEPRFLTGIIAGAMTKSDILGYVGSYPVKGVISGVNAFALGARLVNPAAKVLVAWAYQWDFKKAETNMSALLAEAGADIVSHQNTFTGTGFEGEYGLYSMQCNNICAPDEYIATPVWNWGAYYEMMVRHILAGALRNPNETRPMQFWWGMDSGVVDILYAKKYVPLETHKLVGIFKNLMKEGSYNPFTGPVYDQEGVQRLAPGEIADARQIISMDWLAEGIESRLPATPSAWGDAAVTSELLEL